MTRRLSFVITVLCVFALTGPTQAQLRIVSYNTANGTFPPGNDPMPRAGMDNVLQAIGDELVNGIATPIDVLILQEQDDPSTTTQAFVDLLDGLYGAGTYGRSTVITLPNFTDNIRQTLIYNTNTLSLINEKAFGQTGSGKAARQTALFQLRPVGYDASADIYIYNSHYKAGTGGTNQARRDFEANTIRTDSDALGQGANIIYAGDFNIRSSFEASYQTLLSAGNGQAFDPINTPGNWNNNAGLAAVHTQSPHDGSDGLIQGGMDDRFDFQIVSGELLDNEGLSYIPGSYRAFGNNGTTFNQAVNAGSNTYPLSQSILDDLAHVADHLPVVADYQLPAMMQVGVGAAPATVIVGAAVSVPVTVTNIAPVMAANGADELDYVVAGSSGLTGGNAGITSALAAGDIVNLSVDTSTAGALSGQVDVTSSSQNVANGVFNQSVNIDVLDPAEASFASGLDQNLLTIDFGTLGVGGTVNSGFDLFNLEQALGFTADLDLDSIVGVGDTAVLGSNLSAFAGLAAGASSGFLASFDTSVVGTFSATYTLNLSDEDIAGATNQALTLQLLGEVAGLLDGDLNGDGFVGVDDLNIVLVNWNLNVTPGDLLSGDPTGEGFVGVDDLNVVLVNWNNGTPPDAGDVIPEPATLALMAIGGFALVRRQNRSSSL